jgi:hypothetical protein
MVLDAFAVAGEAVRLTRYGQQVGALLTDTLGSGGILKHFGYSKNVAIFRACLPIGAPSKIRL